MQSFLEQISVLILTYNEAPNIGRTLEALQGMDEIIVLDSNSTDETAVIVAQHSNARIVQHPFETHALQWNYGLQRCGIERPWVLALDADYVLPEGLLAEMKALRPTPEIVGYRVSFSYCVTGKRLSASLYPPGIVLYRRDSAKYVQIGHTQRLEVEGRVCNLRGRIDHDDRKPLSVWISAQQRYSTLEVNHLLNSPLNSLRHSDRIRLAAWPAPFLVFFYTLLAKRCIFDGRPGYYYVLQRTFVEILIALKLIERRLEKLRL
ncbi:glycosyltransferase family 2 protein [Methylocystis echinoides]|uniref:glycosyltransferase family 2 protein n=1 Tax=Methylocystis echinoides TaxID=29468 RepID=UPI002492A429|nr:glycosyltransferase family 2 protein [Methylocystis echinoides]